MTRITALPRGPLDDEHDISVSREYFRKMLNQISDLEADLQDKNELVDLYYRHWVIQQETIARLLMALKPFAEWASCGAVQKAAEPWDEKEVQTGYPGDKRLELTVTIESRDPARSQQKVEIFETAAHVFASTRPKPRKSS